MRRTQPVMLFQPGKIAAASRLCWERGVALVVVGFPATPLMSARARICISASHTREDLEHALQVGPFLRSSVSGEGVPMLWASAASLAGYTREDVEHCAAAWGSLNRRRARVCCNDLDVQWASATLAGDHACSLRQLSCAHAPVLSPCGLHLA